MRRRSIPKRETRGKSSLDRCDRDALPRSWAKWLASRALASSSGTGPGDPRKKEGVPTAERPLLGIQSGRLLRSGFEALRSVAQQQVDLLVAGNLRRLRQAIP